MYEICGKCLHAKSSHEQVGDSLMYCASCLNCCDLVDYMTLQNSSKVICQDGVRIEL